MSCNKVQRSILKRSRTAGIVPTIPPSDDHTDGSWISTDIYKGELFFNQADGILYTRSDNGIEVVATSLLADQRKVYECLLTQVGTSAPTVVWENYKGFPDLTSPFTWTRTNKGTYKISYSGILTDPFEDGKTLILTGSTGNNTFQGMCISHNKVDESNIEFISVILDVNPGPVDGALKEAYIKIEILS